MAALYGSNRLLKKMLAAVWHLATVSLIRQGPDW
jgi:hypothetical protein